MIAKHLPKYIQPLQCADHGSIWQGSLPLSSFPRLKELLSDSEGEVSVDLSAGRDVQKRPFIQGTLKASLPLVCQRCLNRLEFLIEVDVNLSPVFSEKAAELLPEPYEPLLLTEDRVLLVDLVEDELLLNLPMIARHESTSQCVSYPDQHND